MRFKQMAPLIWLVPSIFLTAPRLLLYIQDPTPTPEEKVLFKDDFSDPESGWEVDEQCEGENDTGCLGYRSGVYFVISNGRGLPTWGSTHSTFRDIDITVDATQISAPADNRNSYGLGCRVHPQGGYPAGYFFYISGDGRYAIAKLKMATNNWLVDWQEAPVIQQGNAMNHIRVVCAGETLAFFVNGELLAWTKDNAFREGSIILMATSYEQNPTEVHFDNLLVTMPDVDLLPIPEETEEAEGDSEVVPTEILSPFELEQKKQELLVEAITLHPQGDYRGAIESASEALEICRLTDDLYNEATALQQIGESYLGLSNYGQALSYFKQAISIEQQIGNLWGEARMLAGMGHVSFKVSDYDQSLAHYQQSLAIDQEIGEREGEAMTFGAMGNVYFGMGDYEQALAFYQRSLSIKNESGIVTREMGMLGNIANVYRRLGDYERALATYQEILPIFETWGDRLGRITTLGNIGAVYHDLGDDDQALNYLFQALALEEEIGDREGEALTLNNIGSVYNELSDFEQALDYLEQALDIMQGIGSRSGEATVLNNLGNTYQGMGDYERALEYYEQALFLFREIKDRIGEATTLENIGEVYELLSEKSKALEHYLLSIEAYESILAGMKVEALQRTLAGQEIDVYQRTVSLLVELGQPDKALNLTERSRARAFLNAMGNKRPDLRKSVDAELLHQEETLRGELAALESALASEKSKPAEERNPQVVDSVETQLEEKQAAYEELLTRIQVTNPELASLVTVPTMTVDEIQSLLDDQTTLITYYLTDQDILAFVITRQDLQVVVLPSTSEEIRKSVDNFRSLGLANLSFSQPRSLKELHSWLIEPLVPHLKTPVLGILPHQTLHYVPFAALDDGERLLGDKYVLFYLPSASAIPFLQDKVGRERETALIMGDPEIDNPDLSQLHHAAREANRVAEFFDVQPYVGEAASEEILVSEILGAGVVHLAAHGSFSEKAALFSRIWLTPGGDEDGRLNVYEVYELDLSSTDLVVLSACETQLGELSAGDEVVGLNRAFLYGSPTVIASLWSVDDEATGVLMESFYRHLLEGMGKAQALQAAQLEVRDHPDHPEWAHPYYWAAFVLNGDPGVISALPVQESVSKTPDGSMVPYVIIGSLLLIIFALGWLWFRRSRTSQEREET